MQGRQGEIYETGRNGFLYFLENPLYVDSFNNMKMNLRRSNFSPVRESMVFLGWGTGN